MLDENGRLVEQAGGPLILIILLAVAGSLLVVPALWVTFYFAWRPTGATPVPLEQAIDERGID